jgi:hypothetical protein
MPEQEQLTLTVTLNDQATLHETDAASDVLFRRCDSGRNTDYRARLLLPRPILIFRQNIPAICSRADMRRDGATAAAMVSEQRLMARHPSGPLPFFPKNVTTLSERHYL